jgi:Domain of unknown function (DUF1707)
VVTGPNDGMAAGRGHMRAGHADRERVVAVLKAAYVQGQLTKDELEVRAGQAFAARTYAELAALTADLPVGTAGPADPTGSVDLFGLAHPVGLLGAGSAVPGPPHTPARTLAKAARRSGIFLLITIALLTGAFLTDSQTLVFFAFLAFMAASGFMGYGIVDSRQERRSRRSASTESGPGPSGP